AVVDFVAGFARNAELAAHVRHLLAIQHTGNKTQALFHHLTRFPRHQHLPPQSEKCYPCVRYEVSPMSRAAQGVRSRYGHCSRQPVCAQAGCLAGCFAETVGFAAMAAAAGGGRCDGADAAVELFFGDIERNIADCPVEAARTPSLAPAHRNPRQGCGLPSQSPRKLPEQSRQMRMGEAFEAEHGDPRRDWKPGGIDDRTRRARMKIVGAITEPRASIAKLVLSRGRRLG